MKIRFSNGKDFAISFEANDIESFRRNGLSAIRQFRTATECRVHRGEIHKTVSWFESADLHVCFNDRWRRTGATAHTSTSIKLGNSSYFNPRPIGLERVEVDSLDDCLLQDELQFMVNSERWWQTCMDTYYWCQVLDMASMMLDDNIRRCLENNQNP